jgi:Cytochrome c554 and c-prime
MRNPRQNESRGEHSPPAWAFAPVPQSHGESESKFVGAAHDNGNGRFSKHGLIAALLLSISVLAGPGLPAARGQITQYFPRTDWQPTRANPSAHYLGSKVCATCHVTEAATQISTPMAHALSLPADCQILRSHPNLQVRLGRFTYQITSHGGHSTYIISDDGHSIRFPVLYALGQGNAGQTYLYKSGGFYYESQVSFFNAIQGLDLTLGHLPMPRANLEQAAGVRLSGDDALRCFACHSTDAVVGSELELSHMTPGVTCEGCHGPGAEHVAAVRSGKTGNPHIFNPGKLRPADLVDFCGSCHRGPLDVAELNVSGVRTVRFQPYRLILSKCFENSDGRIGCLSCHDPHLPLQTNASFYDAKCLACHSVQYSPGTKQNFKTTVCPVSRKNCVTCHMPKYELPGGHYKFADHDIRIVHPGEGFPG